MQILHDLYCLFRREHEVDWARDSIDYSNWVEHSTEGHEELEAPKAAGPMPPSVRDGLGTFGLVDPGVGDPSETATLSDLSGLECIGATGLLGARTGGPRTRRSLAACTPRELLGALSLSTD